MFSLDRDKDTICAVSTASGNGAIAIVRLSGDKSLEITKAVSRGLPDNVESHRVYYGFVVDPTTAEQIDEVMITYFAAGRSFTVESVVEISCHGNPIITEEILQLLIASGARTAQPGEFTYRAFANGRIDLIQAESVLSLIESRSRRATRAALRQVQGEQSRTLGLIIERLTWVLAQLEANIDFSAEDIEITAPEKILAALRAASSYLEGVLKSHQAGRLVSDGLRVVILGEPNVGKSSLFNGLIARERSIVSPMAGTTRDTVDAEVGVDGVRLNFVDTAGLRETEDEIEALGVKRTRDALAEADLVLAVFDASHPESRKSLIDAIGDKPRVWAANKCDLVDGALDFSSDVICVSATRCLGLRELMARLLEAAKSLSSDESAAILSARHFELLSRATDHIHKGMKLMSENVSGEFVISETQSALRSCLEIIGQQFDDQVMDRVFREFCLGK